MTDQIRVVALVAVHEGQEAAFEAAAAPCIEATRKEAGCLSYLLHRDVSHAGRFVFIEAWRDQAALDQHMQQPYLRTLVEVATPLLQKNFEVIALKEIA